MIIDTVALESILRTIQITSRARSEANTGDRNLALELARKHNLTPNYFSDHEILNDLTGNGPESFSDTILNSINSELLVSTIETTREINSLR